MRPLIDGVGSEWAATAHQSCPDCGTSVTLSAQPTTSVWLDARHSCPAPDQLEERVHNSSITAPDQPCPSCHHRHDGTCTAQVGGVR